MSSKKCYIQQKATFKLSTHVQHSTWKLMCVITLFAFLAKSREKRLSNTRFIVEKGCSLKKGQTIHYLVKCPLKGAFDAYVYT